jgi:hypothetical protein
MLRCSYSLLFFLFISLHAGAQNESQYKSEIPKQNGTQSKNGDTTQSKQQSQMVAQLMIDPDEATISKIPEILPPSPEASGFVRQSMGTVNKSSGGLQTTIPIYEIKLGKSFTFPISLSYSTQGLKAADLGSRIGLGWNLIANGVINRIIRGAPDELLSRTSIPTPIQNNDLTYLRLNGVANSYTDSQADEYTFSVNGLSGKFVIDTNMIARVTSTQNCKITVYGSNLSSKITATGFLLTGPDGTKYTFRNNLETTQDFTQRGYTTNHDILTTAYFLDRIDLVTGEYIIFNYLPISTVNNLLISQTLTIKKFVSSDCGTSTGTTNYDNRSLYTKYQTRYLSSIETSDNCQITFGYENRNDSTKDNRLISIYATPLNFLFKLQYFDINPVSPDYIKRFLLKKIIKFAPESTDSSYAFNFDYNNLSTVPAPSGVKQDLMGFYNPGVGNLVPNNLTYQDTSIPGRGPSLSQALTGTLKSISYPEGGLESYEYEPNKISSWVNTEDRIFSAIGSSQLVTGAYPVFAATTEDGGVIEMTAPTAEDASEIRGGPSYNSTIAATTTKDDDKMFGLPQFNCNVTQTATISASVYSSNGSTSGQTVCHLLIDVYEDGVRKNSYCIYGYGAQDFNVALVAGKQYKMNMTIKGSYLDGTANLYYKNLITPYIVNTNTYGVRVKKIKRYDPVSNQYESKFYTYGSLDNKDFSSLQITTPVNISIKQTKEPCGNAGEATLYSTFDTKIFHSNSINNIYDYNDGNPIYYKSIIESDDSLFRNGGIEYTFPPVDDGSRTATLIGETPIGVPVGQAPTLSGRVIRQIVFNSSFDTLQCTKYNFDMAISMENYVPSFYVNKSSVIASSDPDRLNAFDVIQIFYSSNWIRTETQINIVYDGTRRMMDTTKYFYETFDNVLPKRIVTTNSKGEATEQRTHYATDYPANTIAQKMCMNNQIELPLEDSILKQNTLQKYYKAEYKDWFNNGKVLLPNYIYIKESPSDSVTLRVLYNHYDAKGNLQELQKANDIKEVYLWGYDTTYPVVKIAGSDYATVSTVVTQAQIDAATGASGSDAALRSLLQNLRTNAATKNALITTYTYIPFVGVSSVTGPEGRTTYYEYDGFNRLHLVKDQDGKIIKKIDYKYAAQPGN